MRTFSIPTATLGLTLTTACGTPVLDFQEDWQASNSIAPGTSDPNPSEQGISGLWLGAHMSWYGGEGDLPTVYSYGDGTSYSYTVNLVLHANLQGSLLYEGESTYEDGSGFSYSDAYDCTATPTGNNTYDITTDDLDLGLTLQCTLDGDTLECESEIDEFGIDIDFTRG